MDNLTNEKGYDKYGRPCKDLYFMNLCFLVSQRSMDPSTKHGCVIVNQDGGILSTGYNGPLSSFDDSIVPLERPDKYDVMEHAERNAIFLAAKHGTNINNSIFYITGFPCIDCLRAILSVGASEIVYGPKISKMGDARNKDTYLSYYAYYMYQKNVIIREFLYKKNLNFC